MDAEDVKTLKGSWPVLLIAVLVFVGIRVIFPYTDMGREAYEKNRQDAINYIYSVQYLNDPSYQKEIDRLVKKYHLEDMKFTGWQELFDEKSR